MVLTNVEAYPSQISIISSGEPFYKYNSPNGHNKWTNTNMYTSNYRIFKTVFLIFSFIAYGLNFEMIGPTLEDLKVFLDVNYSTISFGLVLRNLGYMVLTLVLGIFIDRISKFSEFLMSFSALLISITSLLLPITKKYVLSMIYFLLQGIAQAIYDLTGNFIILNLWNGISTSPLNAMHAGYGIGAILAIHIAKPFIAFDPYKNSHLMKTFVNYTTPATYYITTSYTNISNTSSFNTTSTSLNEVNLQVPYWIAAFLSLGVSIMFFIIQLIENAKRKKYVSLQLQQSILTEDFELDSASISSDRFLNYTQSSRFSMFIQKLLFTDRRFSGKTLYVMITLIILFIITFIFNQGYFTVISRFMFTYLTFGPAKLSVDEFVIVQTLFWIAFIIGRFLVAYITFAVDATKFFFNMLILNLVFNLFFIIPSIASHKIFFCVGVTLLGLSSGPITPTGLMVAKKILDFNSFILSLFIVGLAMGGIIFQEVTGALLDSDYSKFPLWGFQNPNASYIIPYIALIGSSCLLVIFVPIYLIQRKWTLDSKTN